MINTHRIEETVKDADGTPLYYITKGDNNAGEDKDYVYPGDVIGIYEKNLTKLTEFTLFMIKKLPFIIVIVSLMLVTGTVLLRVYAEKGNKAKEQQIYKEMLEKLMREGLSEDELKSLRDKNTENKTGSEKTENGKTAENENENENVTHTSF